MGFEEIAGLLAKKDRSEGQSGDRHAKGHQRDWPEVGCRDPHKEERGSPNRGERKEDQDIGQSHFCEGVLLTLKVKGLAGRGLLKKVFLTECELELEPGLVVGNFWDLVSTTAVERARDPQFPGFVPDQESLLRRVNPVTRSCIGIEEEGSFAFVHVAEGEFPGADGLHDANDDSGAGAELVDGILGFWIGEVIVVAKKLADEGSGGDTATAEAFWIDVPLL